jgi:hypothetical protein
MPKKPSTVLIMRDYQPVSSRRWYAVTVRTVAPEGRGIVCFSLSIIDAPEQAGRQVVHRIPAVLAPHSPLCRFLADAFGIRLAENEPLDLATLAGRLFRVKFTRPDSAGVPAIAAVRQLDADAGPVIRRPTVDWDKTVNTVADVGRKTFTLALATVLVLLAVSGTYIVGLALWWLVRYVRQALGT